MSTVLICLWLNPIVHALLWRYIIIFLPLNKPGLVVWWCSGAFVKVSSRRSKRTFKCWWFLTLKQIGSQVVAPKSTPRPPLLRKASFISTTPLTSWTDFVNNFSRQSYSRFGNPLLWSRIYQLGEFHTFN